MLERLKNVDVEVPSLEELIELSAIARLLGQEFPIAGAEVPEWLIQKSKALRREIGVRMADAVEKELKDLKAAREHLRPAEERRTALDERIAKLEALVPQA